MHSETMLSKGSKDKQLILWKTGWITLLTWSNTNLISDLRRGLQDKQEYVFWKASQNTSNSKMPNPSFRLFSRFLTVGRTNISWLWYCHLRKINLLKSTRKKWRWRKDQMSFTSKETWKEETNKPWNNIKTSSKAYGSMLKWKEDSHKN